MELKIGKQKTIKTLDANRKRKLPQNHIWIGDNFTVNSYLQTKWSLHSHPSKCARRVGTSFIFQNTCYSFLLKNRRQHISSDKCMPPSKNTWITVAQCTARYRHHKIEKMTKFSLDALPARYESSWPTWGADHDLIINKINKINHQFGHGDQELSVAVRHLPWQWRGALVVSGVELNQGGGGGRICLQV